MQSGHRGARLQLIRPLLSMTRTELSYLIHQWQLCIWTDLTNRSLEMRRNRIRYQLLPYVRHYFNPQVDRALASWAEIVHAESVYLEALAACIRLRSQIIMAGNTQSPDWMALDAELLGALPIALQRRILKQLLSAHSCRKRQAHFEIVEHIRTVSSLRSGLCPDDAQGTTPIHCAWPSLLAKGSFYLSGGSVVQVFNRQILLLL